MKHSLASVALLSLAISACHPNSSDDGAVGVGDPVITKVTRENYMSGKKFCETYRASLL